MSLKTDLELVFEQLFSICAIIITSNYIYLMFFFLISGQKNMYFDVSGF